MNETNCSFSLVFAPRRISSLLKYLLSSPHCSLSEDMQTQQWCQSAVSVGEGMHCRKWQNDGMRCFLFPKLRCIRLLHEWVFVFGFSSKNVIYWWTSSKVVWQWGWNRVFVFWIIIMNSYKHITNILIIKRKLLKATLITFWPLRDRRNPKQADRQPWTIISYKTAMANLLANCLIDTYLKGFEPVFIYYLAIFQECNKLQTQEAEGILN